MDDLDLSQMLRSAESDFLDVLGGGTTTLTSYNQTWSALLDALHIASKTGSVDNETLHLAHIVASRIATLASCFLDIRRREESYTAWLQRDYDAVIHQMAALDLNANPKSSQPDNRNDPNCSRSHSSTPSPSVENSSPFLTSARQWLVDNLHNPYPTAHTKAQIAAASSCQVSSVNSWFINTRRRIGWTALCREHFSNCRADMLDAAYRALVEEDPQRPLSPELRHSFISVKVAAEGLYSSTFTRSAFAGDLDAIVKGTGKEFEVAKLSRVDKANLTEVVQDSYPSPNPSITTSPVLTLDDSLTNESEAEVDVAPPIITGSKRRRSSTELVDRPSSTASRPVKRLRVSTQSCLPSPPSSTDGINGSSDHSSPEPSPTHSVPPEPKKVLLSRKRRLSHADPTGIPKRPSDSMAALRIHSVSDPLPRSNTENEYSIDDWYNSNFDDLFAIPPPVDVIEPDLSASWEVELFKDYNIPGNQKCTPKCPPTPAADINIYPPTDLSSIDSLLQPRGGDTTGVAYTTSLDSFITDISQTSIDWTSILNSTEACQPNIYPTFPQYSTEPLSEIDLSMLQLPQVMPTVHSQGDFASKQAKLHQLHAMQEAVWRMEQELWSEGVVI